jgi:hypothetical protein
MELLGLVGAGMYGSGAGAATDISNLGSINVLETIGNLNYVNGLDVLDVMASGDSNVFGTGGGDTSYADARLANGSAVANSYTQHTIVTPPNGEGDPTYYAKVNGTFVEYSPVSKPDKRAHQFRKGFLLQADYNARYGPGMCTQSYCSDPEYFITGNGTSSIGQLEAYINGWFEQKIATAAVPEPSSYLLFAIGLLGLLTVSRKHLS